MRGIKAAAAGIGLVLAGCTTTVVVGPSAVPTALPTTITTLPPIASAPPATDLPATGGGIDGSFGDAGLVMTDMGGSDDAARAVVVTPDGSTIVAGEARANSSSLVTFALAKYLPDGSLDPSFGDGGRVYTPFDEFNSSGAAAVALQADGRIVAAGHAANPEAHHDTFAVARYNPDGTLDSTFGEGGLVLTQVWPETGAGLSDRANGVVIDAQGRIVVVGETGSFLMDFAVVRYLPDGSLDPAFGDGGGFYHDLGGDDRANSVAISDDAGDASDGSGAFDFGVARYLPPS